MISKLISFLILVCFFSACSKEAKSESENLAEIYVNLLVIQEFYSGRPDSLQFHKNELFQNFNFTEEDYNEGISKLEFDKEAWNKFFDYSLVYLDSLRKEKTVSVPDTLIKQF